jgi:uncharacterized protein YceK
MPTTMRVSLLLIAVLFSSLLAGCGSVNSPNTPQRNAARINPHDPMMTSHYLNARNGH